LTTESRFGAGEAGTSALGRAPSSLRAVTRMEIRDLRSLDWPEVAVIYEDGIGTGNATFETGVPSWDDWDAAHTDLRLVAQLDGRTAGWAALSAYSDRCCYSGVAEDSVYVASWAQGQGVGRGLLQELIARSEAAGIWTLQAGIFPENKASLRLHLGCGFRLIGARERIGELDGVWRDVLLLERRSGVTG
jgi:L-amino acid N-acyltransferase YncA